MKTKGRAPNGPGFALPLQHWEPKESGRRPAVKQSRRAPKYDAMDLAVQIRNAEARKKRLFKQLLEAARDVAAFHTLSESLAQLQLNFGSAPKSMQLKHLAYQRHRDATERAADLLSRHELAKNAVLNLHAQLQQVSP